MGLGAFSYRLTGLTAVWQSPRPRQSVAMTCAQITTMPMNSAKDVSAAASSINERIIASSSVWNEGRT